MNYILKNRLLLTIAAVSFVASISTAAFAADDNTTMDFSGTITKATCTLAMSGNVDLDLDYAPNQVPAANAALLHPQNFTAVVSGCDVDGVGLQFSSDQITQVDSNNFLKSTGTATGLVVSVFDNNEQMHFYPTASATPMTFSACSAAEHQGCFASTITDGGTTIHLQAGIARADDSKVPTAGTVSANATFQLVYE